MKDRLTIEQSQHLIKLGVDPSKASIRPTTNHIGQPFILIKHENWEAQTLCINPRPIFSSADILSFLPKSKKGIGGLVFGFSVEQERWKAFYDDCPESTKYGEELIDALFELLVWVLENHQESINQD